MEVEILANGFPPELTSGRLNFELANELSSRNYQVRVVTIFPRSHYTNSSSIKVLKEELLRGGTKISRVGPRNLRVGQGLFGQATEQLLVPIMLGIGCLRSRRPDVLMCESPPLLSGMAATIVSRLRGIPFILRVQDIHPDILKDTGIVRNPVLLALLRIIESVIYSTSSMITTISPNYKSRILSKGVRAEKVAYIPNWADQSSIRKATSGRFRKDLNLEHKFLVTYAGTMSWPQDLLTVIRAARLLEHEQKIMILLVGDGVAKSALMKEASDLCAKNVLFIPLQNRETYYDIVRTSDVCLVSLKNSVKTPEMPSKLLEIMMAGTPIIANVPSSCEVATIIQEARCGMVVKPEDPQAFAQAVTHLYLSRSNLAELGTNGTRYASNHFGLATSIDKIEGILRSVVSKWT